MKAILIGLCLIILTAGCVPAASTSQPTAVPPSPEPSATSAPAVTASPEPSATPAVPTQTPFIITESERLAYERNERLGRGVNLGNALEAPNEGEWGVTLEEGFFDLIHEAGFSSVRVPIRWNAHAGDKPPYTVDPAFFARVDWVVEQAMQRDLAVILDWHHYVEIMEAPMGHHDRFMAIWEQIAEHYKSMPDTVYFELLNEPNGTIGATSWNKFVAEAIQIIRRTNPTRTIIVGPGNWNSIGNLYDLLLPPDEHNLIVTVHYYQPFQFTHQGADWAEGSEAWLGTKWTGSPAEKSAVGRDFDAALKWSRQNHRPIFLGEFGAYSEADMESRSRWTEFIARSAEERGFSWAYWEFCSGFGVYDLANRKWNEPILTALLP